MSRYRPCPQCRQVMVLEDHGELLEAVDVLSFFEYRCRTCGHLDRSDKGFFQMETTGRLDDTGEIPCRWSESDPPVTRRPVQSDSREPLRAETSPAK